MKKAHQSFLFLHQGQSWQKWDNIKQCPTNQMWADVLRKPKQGQAFWDIRAKLINYYVNCTEEHTYDEQER